MIQLSDRAIDKIKSILREEKKEGFNLRIGIKGGGCSGFTYVMYFDDKRQEADQLFSFDEVNVVVDSKSLVYLSGAEIDYTDGLNGSGFVFNNPNVSRTCGCGNSFSA